MRERADKLENWRMKEKTREDKSKEKRELLRRKSSLWIDEGKLEAEILKAITDVRTLWAPFETSCTMQNAKDVWEVR